MVNSYVITTKEARGAGMGTNDKAQKLANWICHQRKETQEVPTSHIHLRAFKALSKPELLSLYLYYSCMVVNINEISQVH